MAKKKKKSDDAPPGAPNWMVTFSDCMTLLLTFFVLLLSFAGFGEEVLNGIGQSFADALPSVGRNSKTESASMWQNNQSKRRDKITKGTETRTLTEDDTNNFMKEKQPLDFKNLRVFTISSEQIFWGKGSALSSRGKNALDAFASFLTTTPARIVISETGPGETGDIGLPRSLAVLKYLTETKHLNEDDFSITSCYTKRGPKRAGRELVLTMLEREIYE